MGIDYDIYILSNRVILAPLRFSGDIPRNNDTALLHKKIKNITDTTDSRAYHVFNFNRIVDFPEKRETNTLMNSEGLHNPSHKLITTDTRGVIINRKLNLKSDGISEILETRPKLKLKHEKLERTNSFSSESMCDPRFSSSLEEPTRLTVSSAFYHENGENPFSCEGLSLANFSPDTPGQFDSSHPVISTNSYSVSDNVGTTSLSPSPIRPTNISFTDDVATHSREPPEVNHDSTGNSHINNHINHKTSSLKTDHPASYSDLQRIVSSLMFWFSLSQRNFAVVSSERILTTHDLIFYSVVVLLASGVSMDVEDLANHVHTNLTSMNHTGEIESTQQNYKSCQNNSIGVRPNMGSSDLKNIQRKFKGFVKKHIKQLTSKKNTEIDTHAFRTVECIASELRSPVVRMRCSENSSDITKYLHRSRSNGTGSYYPEESLASDCFNRDVSVVRSCVASEVHTGMTGDKSYNLNYEKPSKIYILSSTLLRYLRYTEYLIQQGTCLTATNINTCVNSADSTFVDVSSIFLKGLTKLSAYAIRIDVTKGKESSPITTCRCLKADESGTVTVSFDECDLHIMWQSEVSVAIKSPKLTSLIRFNIGIEINLHGGRNSPEFLNFTSLDFDTQPHSETLQMTVNFRYHTFSSVPSRLDIQENFLLMSNRSFSQTHSVQPPWSEEGSRAIHALLVEGYTFEDIVISWQCCGEFGASKKFLVAHKMLLESWRDKSSETISLLRLKSLTFPQKQKIERQISTSLTECEDGGQNFAECSSFVTGNGSKENLYEHTNNITSSFESSTVCVSCDTVDSVNSLLTFHEKENCGHHNNAVIPTKLDTSTGGLEGNFSNDPGPEIEDMKSIDMCENMPPRVNLDTSAEKTSEKLSTKKISFPGTLPSTKLKIPRTNLKKSPLDAETSINKTPCPKPKLPGLSSTPPKLPGKTPTPGPSSKGVPSIPKLSLSGRKSTSKARKSTVKLVSDLPLGKKLHAKCIQVAPGSIFEEIGYVPGLSPFSQNGLLKLFKKGEDTQSSRSPIDTPPVTFRAREILDSRRAQNIGVVLARIPLVSVVESMKTFSCIASPLLMPGFDLDMSETPLSGLTNQTCEDIVENEETGKREEDGRDDSGVEEKGISAEILEKFESILPTVEERESLENYKGDTKDLRSIENTLIGFMKINRLQFRLRASLLALRIEDIAMETLNDTSILLRVCKEIQGSTQIRSLLRILTRYVTFINGLDPMNDRMAVTLDVIHKLPSIKSPATSGVTLLHYIASHYIRSRDEDMPRIVDDSSDSPPRDHNYAIDRVSPERGLTPFETDTVGIHKEHTPEFSGTATYSAPDLFGDIPSLLPATKISPLVIEQNVGFLKAEAEILKREIDLPNYTELYDPISSERLKRFSSLTTKIYSQMNEKWKSCQGELHRVRVFMGDDPKKVSAAEFLESVKISLELFMAACIDVTRNPQKFQPHS